MPPTPAPAPATPFVDVPVRDRFFQSSAFFPMPIVLISTRAPDGATNLAPYSLCLPQLADDGHAMVLVTRGRSKTAENIERTGLAAINFIPDEPALLANCHALAQPVPTAEKMAASVFTLVPSPRPTPAPRPPPERVGAEAPPELVAEAPPELVAEAPPESEGAEAPPELVSEAPPESEGAEAPPELVAEAPPELVAEAVQVFECRWDRSHAHESDNGERRYLLRVEAIRMQPRWHAALEAGRGWPRLPVDYGFRHASASWMSRPRVASSGPRLRPRFEVVVPRPPGELAAAFAEAVAQPDSPVVGKFHGPYGQIGLPDEERSFWSPQLDLRVEGHPEGALVRGRIGPHPHVWTLFMGLHLFVGFSGLGGLMWGLSQWLAKEPATALWAVPVALFLNAFIAGAAFIGQGLGADQTYRLRTFLDEVVER